MVEANPQPTIIQNSNQSQTNASYADTLVRSDVFTQVLDFLGSENALQARKLSDKIAKIEAGNYFKNDF